MNRLPLCVMGLMRFCFGPNTILPIKQGTSTEILIKPYREVNRFLGYLPLDPELHGQYTDKDQQAADTKPKGQLIAKKENAHHHR